MTKIQVTITNKAIIMTAASIIIEMVINGEQAKFHLFQQSSFLSSLLFVHKH